jgi:hypothetical protein
MFSIWRFLVASVLATFSSNVHSSDPAQMVSEVLDHVARYELPEGKSDTSLATLHQVDRGTPPPRMIALDDPQSAIIRTILRGRFLHWPTTALAYVAPIKRMLRVPPLPPPSLLLVPLLSTPHSLPISYAAGPLDRRSSMLVR